MINLSSVIAPAFYSVHKSIQRGEYTHYWLGGGRGSMKSTFAGTEIVLGLLSDERANAVIVRKIGLYLRDSVYEQILWTLDKLGITETFRIKTAPLEIVYKKTGQKILFRGADEPQKLKSIKVSKGYIKYIWYEEVTEFKGIEEIRTINQSLMRGGDNFVVLYTYNPPISQRNWVNREAAVEQKRKLVHKSTYLDAPSEWLGGDFIREAEELKRTRPDSYRHEYLGEVTGTGGEVFNNLELRRISDEEISGFDRIARGLDWGFASDPLHYTVNHYDKRRRRLYIFYEIHKTGLSNRKAAELIRAENKSNSLVVCDSAEPKSIAELNDLGVRAIGARKGPDSVEYGTKWLQDLNKIIIDPVRCPKTAEEFSEYELERDRSGELIARFPDKDNHSIDAVRYSREYDMRNVRVR